MIFDKTEDVIIKHHVELSPYNITQAAKNAASEIGSCTYLQVRGRWYSYLRYQGIVYSLQSKHINLSNTKNITVLDKVQIQYIIPFKQV